MNDFRLNMLRGTIVSYTIDWHFSMHNEWFIEFKDTHFEINATDNYKLHDTFLALQYLTQWMLFEFKRMLMWAKSVSAMEL